EGRSDFRPMRAGHSGATVPDSHRLPRFDREPYGQQGGASSEAQPEHVDKAPRGPLKWPYSAVSQNESEQGTREGVCPKSAAATATVSGEPQAKEPLGGIPGKAAKA